MSIRRQPSDNQGFTLVELAIVIVILGLLVGGVMAGSSLIRASELRSVTAEIGRYMAAVNGFRDKYFALPGDMSNATSYWGASPATENGDGDATIEGNTTVASNETGYFWQHLAKSSFIEGSFTPASWATTTAATNPRSKAGGGYWHMWIAGTVAVTSTTIFDGAYGNAFFLMSGNMSAPSGGILKPEEAWSIDSKLDDGMPATGSVVSLESQGSGVCSDLAADNATTRAAAVYSLSVTTATACSLVFKSGL